MPLNSLPVVAQYKFSARKFSTESNWSTKNTTNILKNAKMAWFRSRLRIMETGKKLKTWGKCLNFSGILTKLLG